MKLFVVPILKILDPKIIQFSTLFSRQKGTGVLITRWGEIRHAVHCKTNSFAVSISCLKILDPKTVPFLTHTFLRNARHALRGNKMYIAYHEMKSFFLSISCLKIPNPKIVPFSTAPFLK